MGMGFYLDKDLDDKPAIVTPRKIEARLCMSDALIENGIFYLPDGLQDNRQIYRRITTKIDEDTGHRILAVSDVAYVNDGGKFVPASCCQC